MGTKMLSGSKRAALMNRIERRQKRIDIAAAMVEMLEDESLDQTKTTNTEQTERRRFILSGQHPELGRSLRLNELDELVSSLGALSPRELDEYHSAAFNIAYYEMLADDLYSMDSNPSRELKDDNPLNELIDDGSASDYYRHDALDQAMI